MKFGFWSKLSWGNWTVETCFCSECKCWFVFCHKDVADRRMFWTEGTLCLHFWQCGWVLIASVSDADAQKAAVSIWLHLLIHNLDFWATHKICSLNAHSGVLLCKRPGQPWLSDIHALPSLADDSLSPFYCSA